MGIDQHGNVVTVSSDDACLAYDAAVDHLLHFRSAVGDAVGEALAFDPDFAMAQVMTAYLGILGTEADDVAEAKRGLDAFESDLDRGRLNDRERRHVAAAHALVRGDLEAGGGALRQLVQEHPRDALALAVGHQVDFFTANAVALRDRVGGALAAWGPDDPHYGLLLGMYAFGLEESGLYSRSLDVGLEALERDALDVWGVHAVAHTFEMQGEFGAGLRFLDSRASQWQQGNFLNVHNWWHYCLYLLEAGDTTRPLEIYDAVINNAESAGLAMEMLDAAALLWRLRLEGIDQTQRWVALASAWDAKTEEPIYAFNDMHAVMSYVGAGRITDAEKLVEARARYVVETNDPSVANVAMTRDVGIPVARALIAFGHADYDSTVELLAPIRTSLNRFGGSHAQRDAVQRTLLEASLRSGQHDLARVLVSERLGINPCSPYSWLKRASLAEAVGDAATAASARAQVQTLRTQTSLV
ncbi:MAG: tetratricopeptide repeat protein [Actinomycetes bacterium]